MTWKPKSTENCCSDLLNDKCSDFWRGVNCGVDNIRTPRQCPNLHSLSGYSEPYSCRAYRVVDRTPSASALRSVVHMIPEAKMRPPFSMDLKIQKVVALELMF